MQQLKSYQELMQAIDQLGIVFLSEHPQGMPSISIMTQSSQWHTGLDDDPWVWKDQAAAQRDCAYLHVGGRPALISLEILPLLLCAKRDPLGVQGMYEAGRLERMAYLIWQQLENGMPRAVFELKGALGVDKQSQSVFARCLVLLQDLGWVTSAGSVRKRNQEGERYGWPVNVYQSIDALLPQTLADLGREEAAQSLLQLVMQHCPQLTPKKAQRVLGLHLCGW